ncbi:ankyrin repeat and fibronectin type-III domain-containing protein 1 [Pseudoliparis swirei]|uniref:ankyrin repeat and fibronectin type-III domain-containing protein 1 n=1 Tax=Pseudoliparis swirei TaxID=2059687 RepID=UPI0024BDF98D|nr:ankyrin repeat and fibronectin type-III domain-containing protein 1 [Pseudoliparis swirei]
MTLLFIVCEQSDRKVSLLAPRGNQRAGDALKPRSSLSLDSRRLPAAMTQQMQNLQLTQTRRCPGGPASPSAAKRLYRNLSEKLRGSSSSFEDAYFFGKTDRLRKASTMQGSDCLLEAVEQQDLDSVQVLLLQFPPEDLDLNTPGSQGLTPLDIAVMTGNTPVAKLLLRAGGREGPHCVSVEAREAHLSSLVVEADLAAQRDGLSPEACHKDKMLRTWEGRSLLYRRMAAGLQHARAPEAPSMVRLSVSSSTSLSLSFQEPRSLHGTVVTKYRVEWSCLKDFSLPAGEVVLDNLQTLKSSISSLTTSLLGTHNLGRVHYEPIKDRHGNVLLVTVREVEQQLLSRRWLQVSRLQSHRKSLSTPEEPYALDVLLLTLQDLLEYQRRSSLRLPPGLYLGYLKLSSSVDQIRVLVSQRTPNLLCHSRVRDNGNVSREEWDWIQTLSGDQAEEAEPWTESHAPLLYYELQASIKSLLKQLNLPLPQARLLRLYSQEVVEVGHGVSFLLLLPAADDVCSAPGQPNPHPPLSGFLHLPLQMFELVHFCSYREKFIGLFCRLSSVLDLDALITQQALREAISADEVSAAKQRHQLILDYIQQLDEVRRDLRWLSGALQAARDKRPRAGVPAGRLLDRAAPERGSASDAEYRPTPTPERRRRPAASDSPLGDGDEDEDESSDVFLPTDSDYDSCDAPSPRDRDASPPRRLAQQHSLGGSAPEGLQTHELRYSVCPPTDPPTGPHTDHHPLTDPPTGPPTPSPLPRSPALEVLSLSRTPQQGVAPPPRALANPPTKHKWLSRSHRPQHWLRDHGGGASTGALSEGVYTKQPDATFISHASCVLEGRKGRQRGPRPHVRRIFVEPCKDHERRSWEEVEEEGEEPEGGAMQDVDSDDQTNAQVSEMSSSL